MHDKGECTLNSTDIKLRKYYEQLYVNKFNNLNKMDQFFERHKSIKFTQHR